ncbi:MAG TPA: HDOD domain-containing protein [Gemmatimonadaceae bacterium]|nr:HDOD domain-containing protein [Gemmatimonadaceae bacterium]
MRLHLTRQPIFDRDERIVAYAVLHRDAELEADAGDPYAAAEQMLLDGRLEHGIEQLSEGRPALLKVSGRLLESDAVARLDPRRVALELDAGAVAEPSVRLACERLAGAGFTLALDRFTHTPATAAVLPAIRIVKVDVRGREAPELAALAEHVRPHRARLLAEHAEHRGIMDRCLELGFDLFQGYRFTRPETPSRRELPIQHVQTFKLLKELRDPDLSESVIEESFRRDVALSYKLLRMVNSAAVGGRGIWSIGHAVRLLGREALYRWLTQLLLSSAADGGVKQEVAYTSLLRGRLCELLAAPTGMRPASGPLFLVGVFSLLDLMLGVPMPELVARLDVDEEVAAALVSREGFFGAVLGLVEAYEAGYWGEIEVRCDLLGVPRAELAGHYLDAVHWAHVRLGQLAEPVSRVAVG